MHHNFWSKFYFYMKLLEDVYFSVESACIQNFSNWHALFVVVFLITFCSRCCMKWDTACRPTDDLFWAITWCARASSTPKQYLFSLGSWKKIYFGHSSKKDHHPGLLPQQDFVLLYKFETSWALLGRLSRGLFTISGASNFKHFKQLFMTLSGLGSLTMWELPRWVSYFLSSLL